MNNTASAFTGIEVEQGMARMFTRQLSIAIVAVAITVALFWFMSFVTQGPDVPPFEPKEVVIIDPVFRETDTNVIERDRLPLPQEMPKPPQTQKLELTSEEHSSDDSFSNNIQIATPNIAIETSARMDFGGGEARPIVRIAPQYPIQAARDGIEGWVQLTFTINEIGGVEDIQVIDAEPRRLFDREARKFCRTEGFEPNPRLSA